MSTNSNAQHRIPRNEDESFYVMGMDLFISLSFFWLAILLLNPGAITVAGQTPKNGMGKPESQITLYLDANGEQLSMNTPDGKRLSFSNAQQSVQQRIQEEQAKRIVLVTPTDIATGKTQVALDRITDWASANGGDIRIGLAVVNQ